MEPPLTRLSHAHSRALKELFPAQQLNAAEESHLHRRNRTHSLGVSAKAPTWLPWLMCLLESQPLSGPQFPLVHNGEISLDLRGLLQSQKHAGNSMKTQGWGSQGTEFPKRGNTLGNRAGKHVRLENSLDKQLKLECERLVCRVVERPVCWDMCGSQMGRKGCDFWVEGSGFYPTGHGSQGAKEGS